MTGARTAQAAFAALIAAAGAWVGAQAARIGEAGGYSPVGPRFFPVLVSVALVVVGLATLLRALRGTSETASEDRPSSKSRRLSEGRPMDTPDHARGASAARASTGAPRVQAPAAGKAPHRIALAWLSAAMLLGALLIERAGFVATMALAFWIASRAFAARVGESALRDAAIAVAVAVAVKLFFSQALGLRLPAGPLGF